MIRSHVIPYAAPGIFTGMILSLAQAFGDNALAPGGCRDGLPILAGQPGPARDPAGAVHGAADQIYSWSRLAGEGWEANTAAAIVVLLVIILVVNLIAILLRNRYDRKW